MKRACVAMGIILGIIIVQTLWMNRSVSYEVLAQEVLEAEPKQVLIEAKIDWTEDRIKEEIHKVFPDAPIMEKVAWCESRLVPDAEGPTEDEGIFQIHRPSWKSKTIGMNMFDPKQNIAFAKSLYDKYGLRPWDASYKCWSVLD